MTNQGRRAIHAGRMAVVAHRFQGMPPPVNPYPRTATKSRPYWDWGAEQAQRWIDQLLDKAP